MSLKIAGYEFAGPFSDVAWLEDRSGVYAVLDLRGGEYYVVDVGESATVRTRVATHDRRPCWNRNVRGELRYAAHYTPYSQQPGRMAIEQEIRRQFNPPCGQR